MRILVGKTFGIGNAVLSIPMIKALATLGEVDVLVGSGSDDFGAINVLSALRGKTVRTIWVDAVPEGYAYDVAIMAIPFDGRWQNGVHFKADRVLDGRKRPGNVERLGFDMWEKHEVEYQMENARELGFDGPTPDLSFTTRLEEDQDLVYVGIGYKRDPGGFGLSKHFGNERYVELLNAIKRLRVTTRFVSTGSMLDLIETGMFLTPRVTDYDLKPLGIQRSIEVMSRCKAYIGNDTGMMHIAASFGIPTCGLFSYPDLVRKNPPFCASSKCIVFTPQTPKIEEIAKEFVEFVWRTE